MTRMEEIEAGADALFVMIGGWPMTAGYTVNEDAVRHAKRLLDARQYVLRTRWQHVQTRAREQNAS
jgi:hypothetical protein